MKKYSITLFLLGTLFFTTALPARAAWKKTVGNLTFICQADNGDAFCYLPRKSPLYGNLGFNIVRHQTSRLDPKEVQEVFEGVFGKDFRITETNLADCGEKHDTFHVYRLTAEEKGTDTTADVLVRITLTTIYWLLYFHEPKDPATDAIFTPKMLDAFCTQIF